MAYPVITVRRSQPSQHTTTSPLSTLPPAAHRMKVGQALRPGAYLAITERRSETSQQSTTTPLSARLPGPNERRMAKPYAWGLIPPLPNKRAKRLKTLTAVDQASLRGLVHIPTMQMGKRREQKHTIKARWLLLNWMFLSTSPICLKKKKSLPSNTAPFSLEVSPSTKDRKRGSHRRQFSTDQRT